MENIFSANPAMSVTAILALFGILASHRLLIYREQKKRFDDAADELRRSFIPTVASLCEDFPDNILINRFDVADIIERGIKSQHIAMINFRSFIKGKRLEWYIEACNAYYDQYTQGTTADEALKYINDILKFTHYGLSWYSLYFWKKVNKKHPKLSEDEIRALVASITKEKAQ